MEVADTICRGWCWVEVFSGFARDLVKHKKWWNSFKTNSFKTWNYFTYIPLSLKSNKYGRFLSLITVKRGRHDIIIPESAFNVAGRKFADKWGDCHLRLGFGSRSRIFGCHSSIMLELELEWEIWYFSGKRTGVVVELFNLCSLVCLICFLIAVYKECGLLKDGTWSLEGSEMIGYPNFWIW